MANTDIIAAQLIDSTSPVLGLRLCFGTSMSHCFPPAPFTNSHSLTLRASRPCRPLPRTPLKLARCPHLLAASLAALPSMSLLPRSPLIRSFPRISSVTITDVTVHLARSHASIETRSLPTLTRCYPRSFTFYVAPPTHSIVEALQVALAPAE